MIRRFFRFLTRWFKYYRKDEYLPIKKEWKRNDDTYENHSL